MKKYSTLLTVLGIVFLAGFVFVFVRSIFLPRTDTSNQEASIPIVINEPEGIRVTPTEQIGGRLLIHPSVSSMTIGRSIEMEVAIDAPDVTLDGADILLIYDPALVKVGAVVNATANSDLSRGPYFRQLVRATVDEKVGKIAVTGFSPRETLPQKKGTDPVTAFSFPVTALQAGVAVFQIEYQPGRSDLSTLVEKGTSKNILTRADSATITIRGE